MIKKIILFITIIISFKSLNAQSMDESLQSFSKIYSIVEEAKKSQNWTNFKEELKTFDVSILNGSNESILHNLVQNDVPIEITRLVLEKGCNPSIANSEYGRTAGYYAKKIETHKILVEYGADVNHLDESGWTVAQYTMRDEALLKFYLDHNLNIESKDIAGRTILFETIYSRYPKLTKLLLEYGANINATDNYGLSPLFLALMSFDPTMLEILLEKKANKHILTIKDYEIGIADVPLVLPEKSSIYDLINLIENWLAIANTEEEWIKEYKYNFEKKKKIIEVADESNK